MIGSLSWERAHEGNEGTWWGFTERRGLVAQVCHYDVVAGRGPGWVGYVRGHRVTGRCATEALARRLVSERIKSLNHDRPLGVAHLAAPP